MRSLSSRPRRRGLRSLAVVAFAAAALVVASGLSGPAAAATAADEPPIEVAPTELPRMSDYPAAEFLSEAAELPGELATAVERDLGETPEEYLARANAAADASDVVEALQASGMNLLGSRLEGTTLVVNVANDTDAATVQSLGATAEVGEPPATDYSDRHLEALADIVGGQGFQFLAEGYTWVCSVGFTGRYKAYPQLQFVTSGHCIEPDHADGTYYYESKQSSAGSTPSRGGIIGAPIADQYKFGGGADVGAVGVSPAWGTQPTVSTWGGGAGALGDGNPVTVTDLTTGVVGSPMCKSGRTTGWTCGEILVVNESYPVYNRAGVPQFVNLTLTDVCALPGDSGSAAMIGNSAFGLGSAGDWVNNCDRASQPNAITAFFPLLTTDGSPSVATALPTFELGVQLAQPTYVRPSFVGDTIRGTLQNAGPRHRVVVTIDGTAYSVTPGAGGQWSLPIPAALQTGKHTFTVGSHWGDVTDSPVVSDSYELLPTRPTVERVDGATRYDVAVKISQRSYPGTAPVVYVAAGSNYPDALSAAPAAVKQGGPLLLTPGDQLLPVVSAEIARLKPAKLVVVGGAFSVNDAVFAQLAALVPDATRIAGDDRFAASRAVAAFAFGTTAKSFVATGTNFPDALSVSSAASSQRVPIVLVNGPGAASAGQATLDLFRAMGTTQTTIAGGPNSVSTGVENSLAVLGPVTRLTGSDRFTASQAINRAAYSTSSTIYLATGLNYPDALAGGALAGKGNAPLYIVPTDCVPRGVIADISAMKASKVVLLGGVNSLNASVASLSACSW
ncbi:cell wall-binding repeat-containing protein [Herbiconiux daphne]|uniref:Cell wall-binding repeat-containing protein n=1 Tax=Herbiconiux daphne TaxID=2970914 RepID=A0ABT2H4M0_9MICO|nr:cell wall-binding repeat-containing protein [Herbiconiux daphne]MCS5734879.1 cell wall-binding repeat-containing protein [Herbiconiux daphne]